MNLNIPNANKDQSLPSNQIQFKIDSLIKQSKTNIENKPIERQKIDDLIRQFNKNEIAAVITTYDDIQYDENGNYIKAKEISKVNLVPRGNNFIVKKESE